MKLELKHLAPYLSYELICEVELTGSSELPWYFSEDGKYKCAGLMCDWMDSDEVISIKPILRPLSDLTKEIEVNGEKFIPFVELAQMADCDTSDNNPVFVNNKDKIGVRFNIENDDDDYTHVVFAYDDYNNFGVHKRRFSNDTKGDILHCPNQLELFQKLFEWHFDIFGLIPEGLAIDINTL